MPRIDRSGGHIDFALFVCISVRLFVCLFDCKKNFNMEHNFLMVSDRALTLQMYIPCDRTFSVVPSSSSRPSSKVKVKYQGHPF